MMSRKFIWLDVGLAEAASGVTRGVAPRLVSGGTSITSTVYSSTIYYILPVVV